MSDSTPRSEVQQMSSKLMRSAIWIAIGSLIAAALVCVVWVLIGDQDGIIGRAFLTILLLAVFAGIAIMESHLAEHRPEWLALSSMITWIVALLVGAVKIWMPEHDPFGGWSLLRFWQLLLVVGIMQLALVHVRLFLPASKRYVTTFTRVIAIVTIALLVLLVALLVFYLTFPDLFHYDDLKMLPVARLESLERFWSFEARCFAALRSDIRAVNAPYTDATSELARRKADWQATRDDASARGVAGAGTADVIAGRSLAFA